MMHSIAFVPERVNNPNRCVSCSRPGSYECSACMARYCSKICQNKDWPHHWEICSPPPLRAVDSDSSSEDWPSTPSQHSLSARWPSASSTSLDLVPPPPIECSAPVIPSKPPKPPQPLYSSGPSRFPVPRRPPPRSLGDGSSVPCPESIVNLLKIGDRVTLVITVSFSKPGWADGMRAVGILSRTEDDLQPLYFSGLAKSLPPAPDTFRASTDSIVACLSPRYGEWYRGYVTRSMISASYARYAVVYIDYGNSEEGVVAVRPMPPEYRLPGIAVKLSFCEPFESHLEEYALNRLLTDSRHELKIASVERDGSVIAQLFDNEGFMAGKVKLESWKSLIHPATVRPPRPPPPLQRQISPRPLKAGFCHEVMVVGAEDVDRIFVQLVSEEVMATLETIRKILDDYVPQSAPMTSAPSVGSYAAALHPDAHEFYRCRIEAISDMSVQVDYIDFGTCASVPLTDLRTLPDRLFHYPACVNRVALGGVDRPDGVPLHTSVRTVLSQLTGKTCDMLVLPSPEGVPVQCTLTVDGRVINEMVADRLELFAKNPPGVAKMPALESAPARPPTPVIDNTLGVFAYQDGPFVGLPQEGTTFKALILAVHDPQGIMLCAADNEEVFSKLEELDELLASYGGGAALGHLPKVGEICLVFSKVEDGEKMAWYRAVCLDIISSDSLGGRRFLCLQVDYGRIVAADVSDIRRIPKRLVHHLPYVAQQAVLLGCDGMEAIPDALAARVAELLPEGSCVEARVVGRQSESELLIVDVPSVSSALRQEGMLE